MRKSWKESNDRNYRICHIPIAVQDEMQLKSEPFMAPKIKAVHDTFPLNQTTQNFHGSQHIWIKVRHTWC